MAEHCPICGAELSLVGDACCPACSYDVSAAPPSGQRPATSRSGHENDWPDSADRPGASRQRPLGISILAILNFVGGILIGAMQLSVLTRLGDLQESLRVVGLSPILVVIGATFLAALGVAAGVGMWLGRTWGWWLGAFYNVYGIARNTSALITVARLADELDGGARGPGFYLVRHGGRIVIHALILLYFFKGNVLHYFGLDGLPKWKALSALVGACLMISGIVSTFAWLVR